MLSERSKKVSYNGFAIEVFNGDELACQIRLSKLGNLKLWDSNSIDVSPLVQYAREQTGSTSIESVDSPRLINFA